MHLKNFQPEQYELVANWWDAHGWHAVPQEFLSKTGLMIFDDDNIPRAAVWLYRTDSPVMMGEWLVVNPDNTPRESYTAIKELLENMKLIAESTGAYLMTFLQNESLVKNFQKQGFHIEEKSYKVAHFGG
jgi:hypothetical protein